MSKTCGVIVGREPLQLCGATKEADQVVCRRHGYKLPKPLRDEVWRLFRHARGSSRHLAAIRECLEYLKPPTQEAAVAR